MLLERLDNGQEIELLPDQAYRVFEQFYILPEGDHFTLWLNNRNATSGRRIAEEQRLESQDGLVWTNRTATNLRDATQDYHYLNGIRQVIKSGDVYEGWEGYYYNVVSGMWVRGIRYITSTSGITWTVVNQTALIDGAGVNVLKEGTTYYMWENPHGDSGYTGSRSVRHRTSDAPDSGWGNWLTGGVLIHVDGFEVEWFTRVRKLPDGTYQLFYRPTNTNQISLASSTNGISFTNVITSLLDYGSILPNFSKLLDFAVVDMDGEDWIYLTYVDSSGQGHIAVARPEQPVLGLTAVNDSPTILSHSTKLTSTISSGNSVTYTWDFGDGESGVGSILSHTYPAVGTYTAVVTAQNAVNVLTATTNVLIFNQYKNFLPTVMYEVCSPSALPVDVILAMDTSGSMGAMTDDGTQTKLDAAKSAASSFIDLLDFPSDQAGIVSFSDNAYLNAPLTVDEADLKNTLSLLTADGATRIDLAIDVSRAELVGTRHRPDSRQVLILLSDGHPTETTVEVVLDMANTAKASGIIIYTIGLAQDVNESLMQNIASSPQNYYFAPSTEDLTTIYEQIADVIRCP
jgi:Mg-chelatase subunit ChlD